MHAPLSKPEIQVIETIGELIDFWGFSKHHGRIWTLLYLREEPFSSPDIQEMLQMSAGLVSMSIKELAHWEVVQKVWVKGDRKDYYTANTDVWHTMTRVVREREYHLIQNSITSIDDALGELETTTETDILTPERVAYVKPRIEHLLDISETFSRFVNFLLTNAEANMSELKQRMSAGPDDDH
jgi:DNA-binding transcriptional regulator GbsR (MarR family)